MPMSERGEGSEARGGSHSNSSTPPLTKSRNPPTTKCPLPLRKRKFSLVDQSLQNKSSSGTEASLNLSSNTDSAENSSICDLGTKRRRIGNYTSQETTSQTSETSPDNSSSDLVVNTLSPKLSQAGSSKRRSSRGGFPVGFYAEEEQKSLAPFRNQASELKSPTTDSESSRQSRSGKRARASGVPRHTRSTKKMSDRRPSNPTEGNPPHSPNTPDAPGSRTKKVRRHTLPGKASNTPDMGVSLSKCLSSGPHDQQPNQAPTPSTSGLNIENRLDTLSLAAAPSYIDQLMRKLPIRKKSNSEQDLQQMEPNTPSRDTQSQRRFDERRRRSANVEAQNRSSSSHVDPKDPAEATGSVAGAVGGAVKLYPLRNRLKVGDTPANASANASAECDNMLGINGSQSLPSSPSSAGVAFMDTFRRLRDTRRFSHEAQSSASGGTSKRNQPPTKDTKQASGPWKRGHGIRKSPVSSKRSSRTTKNATQGAAASQASARTKSTSAGALHTALPNSRLGSHFGRGLLSGNAPAMPSNMSSSVNAIPIPATSTLSVLGGAGSNPSALSASALGSIGAMAGVNLAGSSSSPASSMALASSLLVGGDLEGDDGDMGRLEALLASRGLPPSLFGALGPRMQHILHRSVSSSINTKAQQLLVGLQAADESEQLQAVIEMCQLLVMGNEDTLAGFPIKQVTPALIHLLNMEHNFDMMNHACRALTYMMEALPRSSAVVVDAVPGFLEKLQSIQCMDVAEQSLTALFMLSKKHSKAILQAHGVTACLTFLDFFSTNAQRNALGITANCFQSLMAEDFHYAAGSLHSLSTRLTTQGDKKCVESVCLAYSRLVDCYHTDKNRLQEIAGHDLLKYIQQLLVMSPPVLSTATFIMVIRMLSVMCANCPELGVTLLKNNIAQTLCYLLTNSTDPPLEQIDLVSRTPQELYEITCLISELMPVLPSDGIFSIDAAILKPLMSNHDVITWQWQEDRGTWHNYSPNDSRTIELAQQSGEFEVSVCIHGTSYTLDFHTMQQINDNSGTTRSIQRKLVPPGSSNSSSAFVPVLDSRALCLKENTELASTLIKSLFSLLHEVYSSSAGPAVRYKCLRAMLRMVHFSSPDLLQQVLKSQAVSSHLAAMLSSPDLKIIVGALQMTSQLMEKLPKVFAIYFRREGVMHQIKRLCEGEPTTAAKDSPPDVETASGSSRTAKPTDDKQLSPNAMKISEALKTRKRPNKCTTRNAGASWRRDGVMSGARDPWKASSSSRSKQAASNSSTSSRASFLSSLNPVKWGRGSHTSSPTDPTNTPKDKSSPNMSVISNMHATSVYQQSVNNRETIRTWIREQSQKLNSLYFNCDVQGASHPALTVLNRLMSAVAQLETQDEGSMSALTEISRIVKESDISPFEVIHSGLVKTLLSFLTAIDSASSLPAATGNLMHSNATLMKDFHTCPTEAQKCARDKRLLQFLHVFLGCSLDPLSLLGSQSGSTTPFVALVNKLNGCVNQLEQFPVKVHDLPGTAFTTAGRSGSTSAIKFFNTHQLKCNLQRHPDCTHLKQWKGGPVKVDPLALVQAIERYLVIRGYGRVRDEDDDNSDEDNSDEEIDDTLAAVSVNHGSSVHKLQFVIGDHVLPYNMTVYQAIKVYASQDATASENETESDLPISHSAIWMQTHTIYYRPVQEETTKATSGRKGKTSAKHSPKRKELAVAESCILGGGSSMLDSKLTPYLPASVSVRDPSNEVLALLRVLHGLNRQYGSLYTPGPFNAPLCTADFLNLKLTAKANRQLQDPLVIMTGNLPQWLPQIVYACPFMFPFETRQLLFYAVTFDRDRTLQRLLDATPELNSSDSTERVTPRLERRKRTVNRDDILKQAEAVINDLASSRAMLEIQYENEVGTGLGPTLEFYALVSKELQKAELELWRGDVTIDEALKDKVAKNSRYVSANNGLFPLPIVKNMKSSQVSKLKAKFRFLGKLMAKAVMDSRMLDVRLHECVYKWLLGEERSLCLADIITLDPALGQTISKLQKVLLEKKRLILKAKQQDMPTALLNEKIESLTVDGCSVEDLSINFTLPGYANIELKKGGSDIEVTINNIEQYLHLVVEWLIREGVWKQMDAMREGFESVFAVSQLQVFYPEELEQLFCGSVESQQWDMKQLAECCRPDHGYNHNSKAVKFLLQILSEYDPTQQRSFLQFVTGSPRLPVGGFKSLSPPLTIVRKTFEPGDDLDTFLPSVMTCVNYLKLPDYSSIEIMRNKMDMAAKEGQHSFHLS